jgi:hypothetical protein
MRPHLLSLAALALCLNPLAHAVTPLPSADVVLTQARAQAAAQHKPILLTFSASWCGPCHLFEHFLTDAPTGPIMQQNFVLARLDDGERTGDPNHADSPGAVALRAKLGGASAGYPFIVILDPDGNILATSLRNPSHSGGDNIGYPALPVEIDWFMQMLHKSVPSLSPQDASTLRSWLDAHGHP